MQWSRLWTLGPAHLPVPGNPPYFNHCTGGRACRASGQEDLLQEERELRWAFSVDTLEPPAVSDQLAGAGPWPSALWPGCCPGGGDRTCPAQAVWGPEPMLCRAVEFQDPGTAAAGGFLTVHWDTGAGPPLKVWAPRHRLGTALFDLTPLCSHSARPAVSVLCARRAETSKPLGCPLGWPGWAGRSVSPMDPGHEDSWATSCSGGLVTQAACARVGRDEHVWPSPRPAVLLRAGLWVARGLRRLHGEKQDWRLFQVARGLSGQRWAESAVGQGAVGQGAAPAGSPSSRAPQRLGPTRPRPLHPRAARGGEMSVRPDRLLCPLVCGLHRRLSYLLRLWSP